GTPLKKIGCDALHKEMGKKEQKRTLKKYEREGQMIDFLPSPSPFYTEKIKSCFRLGKQAQVLEEGYPRNDSLFGRTREEGENLREKLGLPEEKKVILYAPTWRDDQHTAGTGYTYELGIDFDRLWAALGEKAVILFRAHYLISNGFDFDKYQGFIR
ncbi:CDP-glycerol:poly(glycerophosphate) glycerophosphotransferase, partial [gut metagenome]